MNALSSHSKVFRLFRNNLSVGRKAMEISMSGISGIMIIIGIGLWVILLFANESKQAEKEHKRNVIRERLRQGKTAVKRVEEISPSDMRRRKRKRDVDAIVKQIIGDAYQEVSQKYIPLMKPFVGELDVNIECLREDFGSDARYCAIQIAMSKEPSMKEYLLQSEQDLNSKGLDYVGLNYDEMEEIYLILRNAYTGKVSLYNANARAADADVIIHLKKCYYEAMKAACMELEDFEAKCWLTHYWHSRINLDTSESSGNIRALYIAKEISKREAIDRLRKRNTLERKLEVYAAGWKRYAAGNPSKEFKNIDEKKRNTLEGSLDFMFSQMEPWLLDEKLWKKTN